MKPYSQQRYITWIAGIMFIVLFLSGCGVLIKKPVIIRETALTKLRILDYPKFFDHFNYRNLNHSIHQSLSYLHRLPKDRLFHFGKDTYTTSHLIESLEFFSNFIESHPSEKALNRFIASNFLVYQSVGTNRKREVLFTGYYEPMIHGSRYKDSEYRFPVYAVPSDLITINLSLFSEHYKAKKIVGRFTGKTVVPYYERKEIDENGIPANTAEILAWVKDPIDLFFLQIQGSGKIQLREGGHINVHYHASNGHPYRSIGRLLIDEGKIAPDEISMQKIRSYLHDNPDDMTRIFNYNPSYVFFKLEKDGPLGYLQVKLTGVRSIALDQKLFPKATISYIKTSMPVVDSEGTIRDWSDFSCFVLNQDTGGAIRGPGRADLFWGNGDYAEIAAGHMQHPGTIYFLVLNPDIV